MKIHKTVSFGFLSLLMMLVIGISSTAQSSPILDEYRPEGLMVGDFGDLPHFDDGENPVGPLPFAPEIIPWSKVVFQRYGNSNYDIYVGNDDGTGQQQLTNTAANDLYPNFNRGATRIVFASDREPSTGDYDLYAMNADGSNVNQLTFTTGDDWNAEYSPDGTKIAFQSVVNNQSDVFIMNANGTGMVNITNHPDYDGAPTWSPDGTQLAFISRRTGGYRVYTMNVNGTNVVQRSSQPYSNNPAWSPDGLRIAYDADIDGMSRVTPEVWMMNADGSGQTIIYKPFGATDTLVSGWSPDGAFITYTRVDLVLYQGTWYWDDAHINAVRWYDPSSQATLSPVPLDWRSHWQTTEVQVPQSAVNPLPSQSANPIQVTWSGSDTGPSGLRAFDVQVRKGQNGAWTDWLVYTTATSGSYAPTIGGETYYFRSRAWDLAHNLEAWPATPDAFTTVENVPPVSAVFPLESYTRDSNLGFLTSWNGFDPGGSGIASYDVQYRIGNGSWTNWLNGTNLLSSFFNNGNIGQTIYFRSRAKDTAQNLENWPGGNGDTQTTLYNWGVRGTVRDNGNTPITGATATTNPSPLTAVPSDLGGNFSAFVGTQASTYSISIQKNGYGSLPSTDFPGAYDAAVDYILPPADNIILDSGFEAGVLGGPWISSGGAITAVVAQGEGHTGDYHLQLGTVPPQFDIPFKAGGPTGQSGGPGPRIIIKDDGRIYLFWNDDNLHYRWRTPDGTWSADQTVGTSANGFTMPHLKLDSQGNIHAIWEGGNRFFYYARLNSNGTWTTPYILNNSGDSVRDNDPQMVLDSQDQPHVVWSNTYDPSPARYVHKYTHRLPNGTWTIPTLIYEPSYSRSGDYSIMMDAQDSLHLVWGISNGGVLLHTRLEENVWTDVFQINIVGDRVDSSSALSDGLGGIQVVWSVYEPSSSEGIYTRYWNDEIGWAAPQKIGSASQNGMIEDLVGRPNGAIYTVWAGHNDNLYFAYRDSYGYWISPEIFGSYTGTFTGMKLVPDSNGRPHVVWTNDGGGKTVYAYQKTAGEWAAPIILDSSVSEYNEPDIAFDTANVLHITYNKFSSNKMYQGQIMADTADSIAVSQVMTVPVNMTSPVLSFMYQLGNAYDVAGGSALVVELDDGLNNSQILDLSESTGPDWTHGWSDLSNWSGQTVTLTFTLEQAANAPLAWARVDEVTVGSGYPDVWSALSDGAGIPGQEVTLALTYGNQGGVLASDVHITQTLPAGLTFVSASIAPISTSPLVWAVGDLGAGSGPDTILVTLKISPSAMPLVYLTSSIDIAPAGLELETANNSSQGQVYTGLLVYLPIVSK